VRNAGEGTQCVSGWGAQDMIGNVLEWTDEWYAGPGADNTTATPWPTPDNADGTWNIASSAYNSVPATPATGIPAAAARGGNCSFGTLDGVFALNLAYAPSFWDPGIGFRCVLPQ
jgi:formylglycine-generating enzyme required for sulfatase activity